MIVRHHPHGRHSVGIVLALASLAAFWSGPSAQALWASSGSGSATALSATLAPPTGLVATCVALSSRVKLDWVASPTPWRDGYRISQGPASGSYNTFATTTSLTYTTPSSLSVGTYYFTVQTTSGLWRSVGAAEVSRTIVVLCV